MTVSEPTRQRARPLFHRHRKPAYRIAWQLELPLDAALDIVAVVLEPEPPPLPAPRKQRAPQAGCGCTERKLCAPHRARLAKARETDQLERRARRGPA